MSFALVLGGGGTVGIAYHVGVLRALAEVGGIEADDADLVVGTSAGSVVGAYVRTGARASALAEIAEGPDPMGPEPRGEEGSVERRILEPLVHTPVDLVRRSLGTAYVLSRSVVRVPAPRVPPCLAQAFPAGLFEMAEGRRRFEADLPEAWPTRPLWLATVDITTGRRVVLGRDGAPALPLPRAVAASCAIPGVYPPVRVGRRVLVDGGVHSPTNTDLATRGGCGLVLVSAPMAYDTAMPPPAVERLARRIPARMVAAEAAEARARGARVLLVRPTAAETRLHGVNFMRRSGWDAIADEAYDATARLLETERFRDALAGAAA